MYNLIDKVARFFETDLGEVFLHCAIGAILAMLIKWGTSVAFYELLLDLAVIVGFVVRELWQHEWKFSNMGVQSWKEWIFPAVIIMVVYAA